MPISLSDLTSESFRNVVEFVSSPRRGVTRIPSRTRCRKRLISIAMGKFHVPLNVAKVLILTDRIRSNVSAFWTVNSREQTLTTFAYVEKQRYSGTFILTSWARNNLTLCSCYVSKKNIESIRKNVCSPYNILSKW